VPTRLENLRNKFRDGLDTPEQRARHWQRVGATHRLGVTSRDGSVTLNLTDYSSYQGAFGYSDRLNIYMGVKGSGRIIRHSPAQALEATIHPGRVGLGVPETAGEGLWDNLSLLALGADLSKLPLDEGKIVKPDAFVPIGSRLHDDPLLTAVLTAMWREAEAHGHVSAFFEHGLLIVANRLLELPTVEPSIIRRLSDPQLKRAVERIEDALAEDLTIGELAGLAGMSRHHFSRAFKAATGLPPYEYLTRRRVERAKSLLEASDANVMQIALLVGFTNPSQFAAAFRRVTGHTPTTWRRLH
jgi:AraC family transcriptional regulator